MLSARVHRRVRTTSGEGTVNPSGASDFTPLVLVKVPRAQIHGAAQRVPSGG